MADPMHWIRDVHVRRHRRIESIQAGEVSNYWGSDLRDGFDLTKQTLPGMYSTFLWLHPPYWNIIQYSWSRR